MNKRHLNFVLKIRCLGDCSNLLMLQKSLFTVSPRGSSYQSLLVEAVSKRPSIMSEFDYDDVVETYNAYRRRDDKIWAQEVENVRRVMLPRVKGSRVLELACGNGFYTYYLMEWRAESVLAVDSSKGMLESAKNQPEAKEWGSKVAFQQMDCSQPDPLDRSPFDVVFAAKLLTHAPDRESMAQMYRTAALNLKKGGSFVSINSPVTEDPKSYMEQEDAALTSYGLTVNKEFVKETPFGIQYRMSSCWPANKNSESKEHYGYRLKKSVYEEAARDAGFTGNMEWITLKPPADFVSGKDTSPKIKKQVDWPDFSILVLDK